MAFNIIINAKHSVHLYVMQLRRLYFMRIAEQYGSELFSSLNERGVELRGDNKAVAIDSSILLATEEDWETEFYLSH